MPIIPLINFDKGASRTGSRSTTGGEKLANLKISKCGGLEDSEGNGDFQKEVGRDFGEKRV